MTSEILVDERALIALRRAYAKYASGLPNPTCM